MRLILAASCLSLLFAAQAFGQDQAYGQPSDLKGLKKVFVDTGADMKNRDSIIRELEKSKLGFEIVDEKADADILLGFGAGEVIHSVVATNNGNVATARPLMDRTGAGVVIAKARGKDRLVYSFSDVQTTWLERKPVSNFVREFLKVYKKGNDIK